jgi:hypothetical protein
MQEVKEQELQKLELNVNTEFEKSNIHELKQKNNLELLFKEYQIFTNNQKSNVTKKIKN